MDLTPKHLFKILKSIGFFIGGSLVMIGSSIVWFNFTKVYAHIDNVPEPYDITVGEIVATSGQTLGQMGIIYAFILICEVVHDFAKTIQVAIIFAWFMLWMGFYDVFDILFFNPFEVSIPKFLSFVFATLLTVARLIWFKNGQYRSKT